MINRKTTKHALVVSAISLILCFVMLLGTTYAWFTDEVSSAGNKIVSGTLKVDLEVLSEEDNTTWTSVRDMSEPLFNYDKWEPGYTNYKILRVTNEGNLALKWKAVLMADTGTGLSELSDVIDVYVKENVDAYPDSRTEVESWTNVGNLTQFINNVETTTTGELPAGTAEQPSSEVLGIAFKMRDSAGNEYQELKLGAFDIRIVATQLTYEEDSFDDQYDKNAEYAIGVSTFDELKVALNRGGNIIINDDITLANPLPVNSNVTLDLNGKTLTTSSTDGRTLWAQKGASLTITGNGTIQKDDTVDSEYAMSFGVSSGSTVIVENGTFDMGTPSEKDYHTLIQSDSKLIINGGTFICDSVYPLLRAIHSSTVEINGGFFMSENKTNDDLLDIEYHYSRISTITISGGTFVNYDPSVDNEGDRVTVANGYKVVSETQDNGDVWYTVVAE